MAWPFCLPGAMRPWSNLIVFTRIYLVLSGPVYYLDVARMVANNRRTLRRHRLRVEGERSRLVDRNEISRAVIRWHDPVRARRSRRDVSRLNLSACRVDDVHTLIICSVPRGDCGARKTPEAGSGGDADVPSPGSCRCRNCKNPLGALPVEVAWQVGPVCRDYHWARGATGPGGYYPSKFCENSRRCAFERVFSEPHTASWLCAL